MQFSSKRRSKNLMNGVSLPFEAVVRACTSMFISSGASGCVYAKLARCAEGSDNNEKRLEIHSIIVVGTR